ncbi:MAG: hypothetical protein R6V43_01700 [Halopseudomonas sp.]
MKKLTLMIIPLALAVASSFALANDGSDYALSNVPQAQAPNMVPQLAHQNSYFVKTPSANTPCNIEHQPMQGNMKMGMMSDMHPMMKDCSDMMQKMKTQHAAG